ncbi:ribosomal protein L37ae (nucleomorph) [Bigelowiella natans]|uniref:Ribosomal protein L37ae n=1 Tax=Bigelowiella natans TaxID=227086 RepID=Q3LWL0_BIGNA|nr:ribosomal protein L37ae [Bigelowiella natans]ABA27157.1 ribosomal protein L37ae [Bigelowiella natans]
MIKKNIKKLCSKFGAKYGSSLRIRYMKIEKICKKTYKCIFCNKLAIIKVSTGLWKCKKCHQQMTGGAYGFHAFEIQ